MGLRIIIDMLAGLHAAHELKDDDGAPLGIVHRDISPQNVLVGVDGSSRLSDFGVARATSKLSTTRTGQLKGKLAYMAPEQARGAKDIDRRADIFAAGVVLWEALACRRLFKGDGEADTLNKVLNEPIPPVRSTAPMVPAALEAVVARALERDCTKRYSTAAEFADALERASRVVGALGTHKDVAAHLEVVLGTEISQQREAVRAWLARSEPSRHGNEGNRPEVTSVTKVEGGRASDGSLPRLGGGAGGDSGSLPRVPAEAGSGPTSGVSGVSSVSSVTSAVSAEAAPVSPLPVLPSAGAPSRRGAVLPWALLAAVVLLGGGAAWVKLGRTPGLAPAQASPSPAAPPALPTASVPIVNLPAATATAPTASAPAVAATAADSSASAQPSSTVAAAAVTHAPAPAWHPGSRAPAPQTAPAPAPTGPATVAVPAPPPPAPAPAPTPAPVPDDISRNPYR